MKRQQMRYNLKSLDQESVKILNQHKLNEKLMQENFINVDIINMLKEVYMKPLKRPQENTNLVKDRNHIGEARKLRNL